MIQHHMLTYEDTILKRKKKVRLDPHHHVTASNKKPTYNIHIDTSISTNKKYLIISQKTLGNLCSDFPPKK